LVLVLRHKMNQDDQSKFNRPASATGAESDEVALLGNRNRYGTVLS
jgi:hypothetical protein